MPTLVERATLSPRAAPAQSLQGPSPFPAVTEALVRRYDAPGPRYTSYPTVPHWSRDFGPAAYAERLTLGGCAADRPLSLYVHLPFCRSLCTYCGCNVIITHDRARIDRYLDAVAAELSLAAGRLGARRTLSQVHWGGGTPTYLDETQIARLWSSIRAHFTPAPGAEVSIEVHPGVTGPGHLTLLRQLGFNRVSLGVQDLDASVLDAVRRRQSEAQVRALLDQARSLGFGGVNFDLIYGLPYQEPGRWQATLEKVIALRPDRVAVYSFAFVPEVKPHQKRLSALPLPRGVDKLALFRIAHQALTDAGYRQIGMDHFALPTDELARAQERRALGRNFQGYTVLAAEETVAFGVTAISDVAGAYAQNVHSIDEYSAAVNAGRFATERGLVLSEEDVARRRIINQLMCNFWVDLEEHGGAAGFSAELERLRALEEDGLVRVAGSQVEVTPVGRVLVRNVAMVFDAYLGRGGAPVYSRTV